MAGAIARSAGWKLVTTSIADWFTSSDGNLGGVNKACAAFFDALQTGDCVVGFLDEIDALPDRATLEPRDRQRWSTVISNVLSQVDRLRARAILLGEAGKAAADDAAPQKSAPSARRGFAPASMAAAKAIGKTPGGNDTAE